MGESPPGFTIRFIMRSIYFNHIPRTGGTTIARMLQNSGLNKFGLKIFHPQTSVAENKEFNKDNISNSDLVMGHYGIAPSIFNLDIETITLLRNPVNQVVSMFSKLKHESQASDSKARVFEIFRSTEFKNDPASLFREWLYDERAAEYTNNGQIHNLINTRHPYLYDPKTGENVDEETQNLVTNESAKEKIDSLLFLGTTENIYEDYTQILDILNSRFNISLNRLHKSGIYNGLSETGQVLKTLSSSEIDYILEKNSIDNHYWEQALSR